MAKIWVEAYGCSASFADSEMISGLIVNGGHTLVNQNQISI
jgi:threonylcarbamoyladenosine tRNA methylthiotransferase CDKAL1